MDTKEDFFYKFGQRRIYIPKKNQFYYSIQLHFFLNIYLFVNYVYMLVFNFQNMANMQQKICISNFQLYCLRKNLQQQPEFPKTKATQQHKQI
jgi:hypothetical protein